MDKELFKLNIIEGLNYGPRLKFMFLYKGFHMRAGQEQYRANVLYLYSKLGLHLQFDLSSFQDGEAQYQVSFRDVDMDNLTAEESNLHDITDILKRVHYFEDIQWENNTLCFYIHQCCFSISDDGVIHRLITESNKVLEYDFDSGGNCYNSALAPKWDSVDYYHSFIWTDVFEKICLRRKNKMNGQLIQEYIDFASKLKPTVFKSFMMNSYEFFSEQHRKKIKQ